MEVDVPEPGHDNSASRSREEEWVSRDILEGVKRRDPDALGRFFDAAFSYVYSLAYRLTGDRHAAEDVTQEVFLKVHRAADRLDVERHPRPWITTITYNACRDVARRRSARPESPVDATEIGERHEAPGTPEEEVLRRERERLLERALGELDEESRAVVILHDFGGHSHEEIAEIVDASHAAVRKRYSRALGRLREIMRGLME
jgi:RNA polymerase sigma factor (sigma-70 family)